MKALLVFQIIHYPRSIVGGSFVISAGTLSKIFRNKAMLQCSYKRPRCDECIRYVRGIVLKDRYYLLQILAISVIMEGVIGS